MQTIDQRLPPTADHIEEALVALDELRDAGNDLKAARIRGGDGVDDAQKRFDLARCALMILRQEVIEIEGVSA